jgi:glycosyltransferase involved in cell wall biosynthesis
VTGPTGALRHELGLALDVPLVGMVGRLAPIKDPATLIRAMARLDDVHLVVIGDGELRSASEHQVAEMGIAHRVHFIGWRYDMPAVLADLDLIALSSLNEGTPLAIIEAAACGIPAVATDVGGVGTVIDHESTGLLVSSRDDEALADALGRLVADPLARHRLGERAREGSHRFSAQRLIADVEQLYDELA